MDVAECPVLGGKAYDYNWLVEKIEEMKRPEYYESQVLGKFIDEE